MKAFYQKISVSLIIACLPIICIISLYFYIDPYNDLKHNQKKNLQYIFQSLGDLTTKKLIVSKGLKKIVLFLEVLNPYLFMQKIATKLFLTNAKV